MSQVFLYAMVVRNGIDGKKGPA